MLEIYAMQVLECDAKKLLSRHAIASPSGIVAATPEEAEAAATHLGREPVFVKAQVGAVAVGSVKVEVEVCKI